MCVYSWQPCLGSAWAQQLLRLIPLSCSGGLCARITGAPTYLCIDVTSSASIATLCLWNNYDDALSEVRLSVCLPACRLFNDPVSNWHPVSWKDWLAVRNEMERCGLNRSCLNLRYYFNIYWMNWGKSLKSLVRRVVSCRYWKRGFQCICQLEEKISRNVSSNGISRQLE